MSFRSTPLEEALDVVGRVRAVGTFSSSGPTMDIHVRVLDVATDGTAVRIARGNLHLLDASSPQRIQITLGHGGYRVARGHRLEVQLASSDYPEFVPQPGTGEDPWTAVGTVRNKQIVRLGGADGFKIEFERLQSTSDEVP